MRINSQETIQKSPSARAWFGSHLAQFIILCVACAGTYPALGLTNSRLFGLDFFNAGLLSTELHELSKIKIRSTIFLENVPQLIIQVIYSYVIGSLENATILAFVPSFLSIVAALVIYNAQKEQHQKFHTTKYSLELVGNQVIESNSDIDHKIKFNKGLKEKLRDSLCAPIGIPPKSIEIGVVTQKKTGFRIRLQHSVFRDELEKKNKMNMKGYRIEMTEDMYIETEIFDQRKKDILRVILNHFQLQNDNEINYKILYQPDGGIVTDNDGDEMKYQNEDEAKGHSPRNGFDRMMTGLQNLTMQISGHLSGNEYEAIDNDMDGQNQSVEMGNFEFVKSKLNHSLPSKSSRKKPYRRSRHVANKYDDIDDETLMHIIRSRIRMKNNDNVLEEQDENTNVNVIRCNLR